MRITISGTLGSGKSTVAKLLSERLKYKYYTTGGFMRDIAAKRHITLMELSKLAETDYSIDKEVDDYQVKLGKEEDNFILEGRLGFHFIPTSVKVFLKCTPTIATARILKELKEGKNAQRKNEGLGTNWDTVLTNLTQRRESEHKRYTELYKVDYENESNYDLIIDTSDATPEEVCDRIIAFAKRKSRIRKGRKRI
jgi:CMP/dCMP kinase